MYTGKGRPNDAQRTESCALAAQCFTAARRVCFLLLILLASGSVLAAGFTCAPPAASATTNALEELEQVVVTGQKTRTATRDLRAWLKQLVGRYTYTGYVDLCGNGNVADQRPVGGNADCIAAASTPNVQCTVNVRWPAATGANGEPVLGGESSLLPAFVIYSLENHYVPERRINRLQLMFTQVDNKGVAEWASGTLVGDTFTATEPCVGISGACQKITRITASPDSDEISMLADVRVDDKPVLRQSFQLHRQSNARRDARSP